MRTPNLYGEIKSNINSSRPLFFWKPAGKIKNPFYRKKKKKKEIGFTITFYRNQRCRHFVESDFPVLDKLGTIYYPLQTAQTTWTNPGLAWKSQIPVISLLSFCWPFSNRRLLNSAFCLFWLQFESDHFFLNETNVRLSRKSHVRGLLEICLWHKKKFPFVTEEFSRKLRTKKILFAWF